MTIYSRCGVQTYNSKLDSEESTNCCKVIFAHRRSIKTLPILFAPSKNNKWLKSIIDGLSTIIECVY